MLTIVISNLPLPVPDTLLTGRFDTPHGPVLAFGANGALLALAFTAETGEDAARRDIARRWPHARLTDAPEALAPAIAALIAGRGELRLELHGTDFQTRVWRELANVPAGQVISYATLAERIGQPNASRAVGTAVGQNPVAWAIPCHRVIRADGQMGGYHWGLGIKRALLQAEGAIARM